MKITPKVLSSLGAIKRDDNSWTLLIHSNCILFIDYKEDETYFVFCCELGLPGFIIKTISDLLLAVNKIGIKIGEIKKTSQIKEALNILTN